MSVTIAYCVELDRNVSIIEARNEYFAQGSNQRRTFTFYCSDPSCVQENGSRTKIVGVNYTKVIGDSEDKGYRSPYFRLNRSQKHVASCVWVESEKKTEIDNPAQAHKPKPHYTSTPKEGLLIDSFVLPTEVKPKSSVTKPAAPSKDSSTPMSKDRQGNNLTTPGTRKNINTTSVLDTLVYSYIEAKNILPYTELAERKLTIRNHCSVKLIDYFSSLSSVLDKIKEGNYQGVAYGGCTIRKTYGNFDSERFGVSLTFYDKVKEEESDDKPLILYISIDMVNEYRYRNTLAEILKTSKKFDYLRVYLLNPKLTYSQEHESYNIQVQDLRFVTFIPTMKKR